jgi:hypothetical protein
MGAVKEAMAQAIDSVFEFHKVELKDDTIYPSEIAFSYILAIGDGDDNQLRDLGDSIFDSLAIDTADFVSDWAGSISAAIGIYTGLLSLDEGCTENYFDWLAYFYHHNPRHVGRALWRFGLTEKACQAIIYLLAGRLLETGGKLSITKFDYLDNE